MDFEFEKKWRLVVSHLENDFGEEIDLEAILFLIGVQELGKGAKRFSKDEKLNLMHIGICTVLEPYGYYEFEHLDKEGWPHFTKLKNLPYLKDKEQKELLRRAVTDYFEKEGFTPEQTL